MKTLKIRIDIVFLLASTFYFFLIPVQGIAQMGNMTGQGGTCPMCGAMGWGGMILMGVLIISAIAALCALTYFLIRRSRTHT